MPGKEARLSQDAGVRAAPRAPGGLLDPGLLQGSKPGTSAGGQRLHAGDPHVRAHPAALSAPTARAQRGRGETHLRGAGHGAGRCFPGSCRRLPAGRPGPPGPAVPTREAPLRAAPAICTPSAPGRSHFRPSAQSRPRPPLPLPALGAPGRCRVLAGRDWPQRAPARR